MSQTIIVIGAGIAGLAAGCYAQMNGYSCRIFERHTSPGGLCTSWFRQGFTFDACIHWLVGSRAGSPANKIWRELGAARDRPIVNHEEFTRIQARDGSTLIIFTDIDRLERHMNDLSPGDSRTIAEFCNSARKFTWMGRAMGDFIDPPRGFSRLFSAPRFLPFLTELRKYARVPVTEFAARFRDPFLRRAFAMVFDLPDFPMAVMLMTLAFMHECDAGYPVGGSLAFARAIEGRYRALGGEIRYGAAVRKILVDGDMAVGVRLADGSELHADVVISAADGHATIFEMLEGKYADETVRGYYAELPIFRPIVQVSLGVARDLSGEPHSVRFQLQEPIRIAGESREWMGIRHFSYDSTMAPPGKSVIIASFESNYAYWEERHRQRELYEAEKMEILSAVVEGIQQRWPGIRGQVEAGDVATPITWARYTGNWQGSIQGWLLTTETFGMMMGKGMRKVLPGLKNFYMTGQWVEPGGGLPTVAISARRIVQAICKADKKAFVAREV